MRNTRLWLIALCVAAFGAMLPRIGAADDLPAQDEGVSAKTLFTFRHVIIDSRADKAAACLRFSQNLNTSPDAHYGDYIKLSPAAKVSITASGTDLCLGGLDYATSYKLTILAGLPSASGDKLSAGEKLDLALADRPPLVAIAGDGFILPAATAKGLVIQTVNVAHVKIHVLRMSDKLLPSQTGNLALSGQTMDPSTVRSMIQQSISVVWTGTMDLPSDHNRTVETAFALARVIPQGQAGLYLVVAENALKAAPDGLFTGKLDDSGANPDDFQDTLAAHWVVATDLALTSLTGTDGLHVFARGFAGGKPAAGVDIKLISAGQDVLAEATTDAQGQVTFGPGLLAGSHANAAQTIVAYSAHSGFAFQDLTKPAFDLSDRGVTGRPAPAALQAFMYTDRGIYRPGETINLMALLRDRVGVAVENTPLKILVRRPDGVADRTVILPAQPAGGFWAPLKLSATAARGMWTMEAYGDPTAPAIGQIQADVEDFVPEQLKVTLKAQSTSLAPGANVQADLTGIFLYGAPAAGLPGEGDLKITRDDTPVKDAAGYSFGLIDDKFTDIDNPVTLDNADDKGDLPISVPLPDIPATSVPLKAVLTAGLQEPSGRAVSDQAEIPIRAQSLLIGIKPQFADGQVPDGVPAHFNIQAFDASGKAVAAPGLHWALVEEIPHFDWVKNNNGSWTWHYSTADQQMASGTLDATAAKPLDFTPSGLPVSDWGTYRLIIADDASGAATSVRFDVGWSDADSTATTPDKAAVTSEAALLTPGQSTKIHIKGPFAGQAQIIIANDKVFSTQLIDVPKAGAVFDVTADAAWGAGAYVIVSEYRPLASGGPHDPVRALGLVWLGIDPAAHKLAVTVDAPAKITPRQSINVPVHIAGIAPGTQAFVTLAAVDEGILQITKYANPDPLGFFYGQLKLGLDIRDDYGNLLAGDADVGAIHNGGDAGSLGGPGLPVTSTKIVSLFQGPVTVGKDGSVNIPVTVPDFEGQLRMVAVAYDNAQMGSGASQIIVRDPVIADLSLPRFLAPGDTAQLALSLHNTDNVAGAYHLAIAAAGPASITPGHNLDYNLATGQRVQDAVTINAQGVGIVAITTELTGPNGYDVTRHWQIAIRAAHAPVVLQQVALQAKGTDYTPDPKLLAGFVPGSLNISVGYNGFQGIDVPGLLQTLWTYPYGCTEQLTSTAFPLLYYNRATLLGGLLPGDATAADFDSDATVKSRVQDAIDSILDRQDATGAFGLWRVGDNLASDWLNVYVMDFLGRAKAAGYAIPATAISRGTGNLLRIAGNIDSGAQDDSNTEQGTKPAQATLAYAEYVLARSGQADIGLLRRLHDAALYVNDKTNAAIHYVYWVQAKNQRDDLAQPLALAQLSGALALMGDKSRADGALQMAVANIGVTDYPRWWFDSFYWTQVRDIAGIIGIAGDEGNQALAASLLTKLNALHVNQDDLNTQDAAWLLAAAHALDDKGAAADLRVNGAKAAGQILPVAFAPTPAQITNGVTISNDSARDLWRTVTLTGVPAGRLPAQAAGYVLTKDYYTLDGKPLDIANLQQSQRFIVSLSGAVKDDKDHRTIIADLLPAGWEIEAPINDDSTDHTFLGALTQTNISEARDDRFVAAFDLGSGWGGSGDNSGQDDNKPTLKPNQFHVAYIVRVVTPGSFIVPEAVVADMYRPAEMARTISAQTTDSAR